MLKTEKELQEFLRKQPSKSQVIIELQELSKEIKRLEKVAVEYGRDNSRLSNEVNKKNHCWTHHTNYDNKDKKTFFDNQRKKQNILDQITDLKGIEQELKDYTPVEYVQTKLDFKGLKEQLEKYI